MYKDKDKQKEADRERQRRHRRGPGRVSALQAAAKSKGVTESGCDTKGVTQGMTNEGVTAVNEHTHCHTLIKPKRGKDIKTFEDLPEDVQKSINRMSINKDGTFNQTTKANRTAIAIHYQHLFPGRFYNTGVA